MRYMIVDDNAGMRSMIRQFVCTPTDAVVECGDGGQAVTTYDEFHPDLVLMDIEMTPMDGFSATERIRQGHPDARIIFISSHDTDAMRSKAFSLQAEGFVHKENLTDLLQYTVRSQRSGS